MKTTVGIYYVEKKTATWGWFCKPCLDARKDAGWEVRDSKPAPHGLTCDDAGPKCATRAKARAGVAA